MTGPARVLLLLDPPLDPTGEQGRDLLRRELIRPEYAERDLLGRVLQWALRQLDRAVGAASASLPVTTLLAMVVFLLLLASLGWLISRARGARRAEVALSPALGAERLTAAQLRARAEAALAAGRVEQALVEAFRSLAVRQVERGVIPDVPDATAHELGTLLGQAVPEHAGQLAAAADAFDRVLYGGAATTARAAQRLLDLDAALDTALDRALHRAPQGSLVR